MTDPSSHDPLDITVGAGTPVRVHVSRRPLTNVQALTRSLARYQSKSSREAQAHLKAAGDAFRKEQAEQQAIAQNQKYNSSAKGSENQAPQQQQRNFHRVQYRQPESRSSSKGVQREPFYPPPNLTHGRSSRGKRSLKQVGTACLTSSTALSIYRFGIAGQSYLGHATSCRVNVSS